MRRKGYFLMMVLFSTAILGVSLNSYAWNLKEAAAPYKGSTVNMIIN